MTPTSRPARTAAQLAQLLDQAPVHPTQHIAVRLTTLAHLLWTAGHIATTRAHDHAPGIRAANLDGRHGTSHGDPTYNAATAGLDDTAGLDAQLRNALAELDRASARVGALVIKTTTVNRTDDIGHQCAEALCEADAAPGRLGYCEADYRRRLRWAEQHNGTTAPDWDSQTHQPPPRKITRAERLGIHQAPALTHEQLADRAIRRKRKTA